MKLLYLSCHPTLEYEELVIFDQLGIETFSTGFYKNADDCSCSRPRFDKQNHLDYQVEFDFYHPKYQIATPVNLNSEFIKHFDVIFISGQMRQLVTNWESIKHKTVVWRTCGLTNQAEQCAQGLRSEGVKIVRWSPAEEKIPNYAGADAVIRASISENDFSGWNGSSKDILVVSGSLKKRGIFTNYSIFSRMSLQFPTRVIGGGNDDIPGAVMVDYPALIRAYQDAPVFLSLGTKPSPYVYTLIEAMMVGCPIVTVGPQTGNLSRDRTYEGHLILESGVDGICSDNHQEMQESVTALLNDRPLSLTFSENVRSKAVRMFGREQAIPKWKEFFNTL